ncbi:MAG: phosphate ABC transporter substrate-binding protein [Myxococcota bacterium]|nr:phosphate ABC transporter substrate-binding protein [Myxococcota bacterium]
MTRSLLIASLAVLSLTACKKEEAAPKPGGTPAAAPGRAVTVKGSDTMVILGQRWAEEFMKADASKKVQVTGGGSGTGIAALINGTTEIAMSSRSMKDAEKQKVPGGKVAETVVARDGVTFYVNEANPVTSLAVEQLRDIYVGDLTNWKQVGGPDARIVVYSRENSSGTYVFVKEEVLGNMDFAPEAQTLPGTAAVVNAVGKETHGIGFGGAAYAKGIKELKVKVGAEEVAATLENVQSGKYPLARPLFFYTRGEPQGDAKALIDYALSAEGQKLVQAVGYFPVK